MATWLLLRLPANFLASFIVDIEAADGKPDDKDESEAEAEAESDAEATAGLRGAAGGGKEVDAFAVGTQPGGGECDLVRCW